MSQCLHATLCSAALPSLPFIQTLQTQTFRQPWLTQSIMVWGVNAATPNPDYLESHYKHANVEGSG